MRLLKQSTAVTVKMGPFVDDTDGKTAETALTISQADIRLTKNGGAFAQTNNSAGATHDENGYYGVPLDTTDTNTLGILRVAINESGALPVWADFGVMPANVWDSLFGSDRLQVHADEITAGLITAAAIATDAIDADAIADNAINAGAIASGAITAAKFAAGAIDAAAIATGAIDADAVAADAVTELQSGLATAAALQTVDDLVDDLEGRLTAGRATNLDNLDATVSSRATAASIAALNNLSAAQVNSEVDTALADVGLTTTVTGRIDAAVSTRATPAQVNSEVDTALADYDGPTSAELVTEINSVQADIAAVAAFVDTEIAAIKSDTAAILLDTGTDGVVVNASGLAADAVNEITAAIAALTLETGLTWQQGLQLITAAVAGKLSGAATATNTIRNAVADSKDRIVATVDADGNRTAITYDLT